VVSEGGPPILDLLFGGELVGILVKGLLITVGHHMGKDIDLHENLLF
jgi:hypothetical protein